MSKDIYGIPNRHYGSEPDTERDEAVVTEWARHRIAHHGFCPACKARLFLDDDGELFQRWTEFHAETCTPLRERVADRMGDGR